MQRADFSNYDPAASVAAQRRVAPNSLTVRAFNIDSTIDVRIFDTNDITSNSGSIENFFQETVKKITNPCFGKKRTVVADDDDDKSATGETHAFAKRQTVCVVNSCDIAGTKTCVATPKCNDLVKCDNCLINGVCYLDSTFNPTNRVELLNKNKNKIVFKIKKNN